MELKEPSLVPTLARSLGDIPHVSGLLHRIARLSGAGDRVAEWLLKIAVQRGADHYRREFDPALPPDSAEVTDEEIGVALCLGQHSYHLDQLRAAAQLLSSPRVDPVYLGRLAVAERCEPVLLHIAALAGRWAPDLSPWDWLRRHLAPRPVGFADQGTGHWFKGTGHWFMGIDS